MDYHTLPVTLYSSTGQRRQRRHTQNHCDGVNDGFCLLNSSCGAAGLPGWQVTFTLCVIPTRSHSISHLALLHHRDANTLSFLTRALNQRPKARSRLHSLSLFTPRTTYWRRDNGDKLKWNSHFFFGLLNSYLVPDGCGLTNSMITTEVQTLTHVYLKDDLVWNSHIICVKVGNFFHTPKMWFTSLKLIYLDIYVYIYTYIHNVLYM